MFLKFLLQFYLFLSCSKVYNYILKGADSMAMELDYDYLAKLVERTQMGDSDAFAELYTATYQKQYRFAYQYTKDSYLAQDILQDVYILVLKNIHTLKNPRLFVS